MKKRRTVWRTFGESLLFTTLLFCVWWYLIDIGILKPIKEIEMNGFVLEMPFVFSRWIDFAFVCIFWLWPLSFFSDYYREISEEAGLFNLGVIIGVLASIFLMVVFFLMDNSFLIIYSVSLFIPLMFSFLSHLIYKRASWRMNLGYSITLTAVSCFCFGFPFMLAFLASFWVSFFAGILLGLVIRLFQILCYVVRYGKDWKCFMPLSWRI